MRWLAIMLAILSALMMLVGGCGGSGGNANVFIGGEEREIVSGLSIAQWPSATEGEHPMIERGDGVYEADLRSAGHHFACVLDAPADELLCNAEVSGNGVFKCFPSMSEGIPFAYFEFFDSDEPYSVTMTVRAKSEGELLPGSRRVVINYHR